jgi:hypothetical protein
MRENDAFNGITDVMQAIASSDIAINEVWPQRGKLSGGKLREKLVLVRHRWWHISSRTYLAHRRQHRRATGASATGIY